MREELNCPRCGSSQTTYRVKTKDRICYKCGNIYNFLEVEINKEGDKNKCQNN